MLTDQDFNRLSSFLSRFKLFVKKYNPSQYPIIDVDINELLGKIETANTVLKNSISHKRRTNIVAHVDNTGKVTYK